MAEPISIFVGPSKTVFITVPSIAKNDLLDIASVFLGREHNTREMRTVLEQATKLTFILTTGGGL